MDLGERERGLVARSVVEGFFPSSAGCSVLDSLLTKQQEFRGPGAIGQHRPIASCPHVLLSDATSGNLSLSTTLKCKQGSFLS